MPDNATKPKAKRTLSPEQIEKMRQGRIRKAKERKEAKEKLKQQQKETEEQAKRMVIDQRKVAQDNAKAILKKKMREEVEKLKSQVHADPDTLSPCGASPTPTPEIPTPSQDTAEVRIEIPDEAPTAVSVLEEALEEEEEETPTPSLPRQDAESVALKAELSALREKLKEQKKHEDYGKYRQICDKIAKGIKGEERTRFYEMTADYDFSLSPQENAKAIQDRIIAEDNLTRQKLTAQVKKEREQAQQADAMKAKRAKMRKVFSMY